MFLNKAYIFYILYIIAFISVTFLGNGDISQEINKKRHRHKYCERIYIIIFILSFIVSNILMYYLNTKYTIQQSVYLGLLMFIYLSNLGISFFTDPMIHRINRHLQRISYITNIIIICRLAYVFNFTDKEALLQPIIFAFIVLGVMFFTFPSVGSADFRCMFLFVPAYLFFVGIYAILAIIGSFVTAIIYMKIKQRKEKVPVPIGDKLLLLLPIITFISIYYELFMKLN